MKKKQKYPVIRRILWATACGAVIVLSVAASDHKQSTLIKGVEASVVMLESGANLVTQQDVLLDIENKFGSLTQSFVGELDAERMEYMVLQNPFLKNANVYVDAKNLIHVAVEQREPIVRVMNGDEDFYLDRESNKIPTSAHFTPRVLVATGEYQLETLFEMSKAIYDDAFLNSLVSQVIFDKDDNVVWIPKVGAKTIVVGGLEGIEDKIERLKIFYKEGLPNVGWDKYKELDIRFAGQVIGKKV